jgi:protein-tyrosine-phosphatase/DNA-binding transcriptional ArsR family regulator
MDVKARRTPTTHAAGDVASSASSALAVRAARFSAVGEPVRLAIVEHLALGDAAPSELGALVELASNHLAFHLKVLQDAGLVRKVRSEGDRRRSYVQLRLDDPAVAALIRPPLMAVVDRLGSDPSRVVFVCTHNSARSQLAAAAWARVSDLPAASAGTHPAPRVHPRAVAAARRHGLKLRGARTRHLDDTARPGDLLVAVCDNAYEALGPADGFPGDRAARGGLHGLGVDGIGLHWSVPDPVRVDTDDAFEDAYEDLARRVAHLADTLTTATAGAEPVATRSRSTS